MPNLTYVTHPGHKHLVKEILQKIIFNDTATMVLDVANNYISIMLEDKVKHNHGGDVLVCSSPGNETHDFILDNYFEIGNNNIVYMECMDSGNSFSVALNYIAQWCGGSFGDDGGDST